MERNDLGAPACGPVEWRPIAAPYGAYEVSSDGKVRRGNRELAGDVDRGGYHRVLLSHDGHKKRFRVNRLVCTAFHGEAESPEHFALHNDGNSANDCAANLRWGTRQDNAGDSVRHGTFHVLAVLKGEMHHNAKLTLAQVEEMRSLSPGLSQRALAKKFGISLAQVSSIIRNEKWRVDDAPNPAAEAKVVAVPVGIPDAILDKVSFAITKAGCPGREGPYGGYDYGHNTAFYGPEPEGGRYVVRDFRDPRSPTWGAWVHQTHNADEHEQAFIRLTRRHIAQAAIHAYAQAIEARQGGNGEAGAVHESAVPDRECAQGPTS